MNSLPFVITPHLASLMGSSDTDPIRRQFMSDPREELADPFALADPLGEARFRVTPRLVHQYRDRALLLTTGSCAAYCRYCFRRERLPEFAGFINEQELAPVLVYLRQHS